jgi:MFS family permease
MNQAVVEVEGGRRRWIVVSALGIGQILAWGSSYYLLAVLAVPIARDTGWSPTWIVGGLSLGFLVSGFVSPSVGGAIERFGGRPILMTSAVLLAVGLLGLGLAPNLPSFVAAWILVGCGMSCGLYDPAFSTLGRIYGEAARPLITGVTLWGGFASTVCWPISAFLTDHLGWRGACLTYAAVHIAVVLPIYAFGVPQETQHRLAPGKVAANAPVDRQAFVLLAAGFTLASVIMTLIAVDLLALLQSQGVGMAAAVGLGALIGPSQVGARVFEMLLGRKAHPIWSLLVSTVLVAVGLGMLIGAPGTMAVGIVLYGSGSGIRSIARGTVPLALFGREGYAALMGRIAMPTLVAQAASPLVGAWLLDSWGATPTLAVLYGAAMVNVALVLALIPSVKRLHA